MANALQTAGADIIGALDQAYTSIKDIVVKLLPEQLTILGGLVTTAINDAEAGDSIEDIATAVQKEAATQELTWVETLGEDILQALIALVGAELPAA